MEPFRFKQFAVYQDFAAMKVNTDAVLLGAWLNCNFYNQELTLLDIGTGTGVISLMLAQRLSQLKKTAQIDAVEIDLGACKDAEKNFKTAQWNNINISLTNTSIQKFSTTTQKYNLIFSNPPFFISSLKSPDKNKTFARHTDTLSQTDLINCTLKLIEENGRLALVLPITEGDEFLRKINFLKDLAIRDMCKCLVLRRLCKVSTIRHKPPKRYLMEFEFTNANDNINTLTEELVIMENGKYTKEYTLLLKEFLVIF